MLPKPNRIVQAADFRRVVRTGERRRASMAIVHVCEGSADHNRFGFVVSKQVGGAVLRNRIRRRMAALARTTLNEQPPLDFVIRALPSAATADFARLDAELTPLLRSR